MQDTLHLVHHNTHLYIPTRLDAGTIFSINLEKQIVSKLMGLYHEKETDILTTMIFCIHVFRKYEIHFFLHQGEYFTDLVTSVQAEIKLTARNKKYCRFQ